MRRTRPLLAVTVVAGLVCWHLAHGGSPPTAVLPSVMPRAASADQLIVEPDDGMAVIDRLLGSPRRSLDLAVYELADPTAEEVLAADAARGIRVRVILDQRLQRSHNLMAYDYLRSRGVTVVWSADRYFATHEKAFVIDGSTAVVMSLNLTSQYYATSRDAAVVDHDPADVAAIEAVFDADLHGGDGRTPAADDLVWSPRQSWADMIALVARARVSVALESEELTSPAVIHALIRAAERGVRVSVAMTYDDKWRPAFAALRKVGAQIRVMYGERPLYLHAKLIVVDGGTSHGVAFVGSENLTDASLLHNRELGIVLLDSRNVARVATVIATDFADGTTWSG